MKPEQRVEHVLEEGLEQIETPEAAQRRDRPRGSGSALATPRPKKAKPRRKPPRRAASQIEAAGQSTVADVLTTTAAQAVAPKPVC